MNHEYVPLSPEIVAKAIELGLIRIDLENACVRWWSEIYTFSDAQWICWQPLFRNLTRGNLPMLQGRVLAGWHGSSTQVADIFKRHPAWKNAIVGDGRGRLWLRFPDDYIDRIAKAASSSLEP